MKLHTKPHSYSVDLKSFSGLKTSFRLKQTSFPLTAWIGSKSIKLLGENWHNVKFPKLSCFPGCFQTNFTKQKFPGDVV